MKPQSIAQINSDIAALQKKRESLERKKFADKTLPELLSMVGKTFVYRRNCYSCPEKESDYWDMFRRVVEVVAVEAGAWIVCEQCSVDSRKTPTLTLESTYTRNERFMPGWVPCKPWEFAGAKSAALHALLDPSGLVEYLRSR